MGKNQASRPNAASILLSFMEATTLVAPPNE